MSQHSDLPPNPREAKRRSQPLLMSLFPVTVFLIAASVLVALFSRVGADTSRVSVLFYGEQMNEAAWDQAYHKLAPGIWSEVSQNQAEFEARIGPAIARHLKFEAIRRGEVWRIITPIFIHLSFIHILFNMMWTWDLGRALEIRYRSLRFTLLVLIVAAVSNTTQALVSNTPFGGMSGVVYGLFGYIVVHSKYHPAGGIAISSRNVALMMIWLVVCFTGAVGPVANAAHVAGLVTGAVIGGIVALRGGAWGVIRRRHEFKRALATSDAHMHRCATCGKTENDDPSLDFRVSSDGEEYCVEHLPRS